MARIIDIVLTVAPKTAPPYRTAFKEFGDDLLQQFDLTTPDRVAHFLARCISETGGFTTLVESAAYTRANLATQWDRGNGHKQFRTKAEMVSYAGRPEELFNRWYGNRMGNGGPASGDGFRYRGRGPLQTTGKAAYRKYGKRMGVDLVADPDLILDPRYILLPSLYEWQDGQLNAYADKDDALSIARIINVGTVRTPQIPNGYKGQLVALRQVKAALKRLGWAPAAEPSPPTVPADAAAPAEIDPDDGLSKGEIEALQQRLRDLGYSEVGRVDGKWGPRTVAAVSAFQATSGLPVTGDLDKTTAAALTTAPPRPVSESRATTTAATMRQHGDPVAKASFLNKVYSAVAGFFALIFGVAQESGTAVGYLSPMREFVTDVPPMVWFGAVAAVAAVIWWQANRAERAAVADVRSGRDAGPA
ncbi:peptidoglycan-binding protein [Xanthobacter autotrophicus]|uniref:peptidoglycan-binding protein n=1 Tax=Xanthobacter autotrophicus TaxID=280 RepID=UPI0037280FF0